MKKNIKEFFQLHVNKYASELTALKRKNNGFVTTELLFFGGIIAFLFCYFSLDGNTTLWIAGAVICLMAYIVIRHLDDKNKERTEHLAALLKAYENEIKAQEGDFSAFETGELFLNPQHPYAYDLDIFGKNSLFNRICRTITSGGSLVLANHLTQETPPNFKELKRRRELIKELAEDYGSYGSQTDEEAKSASSWRMDFLALGEKSKSHILSGPTTSYSQLNNLQVRMTAAPTRQNIGYKKIDSDAVGNAINNVSKVKVPTWYGSPSTLVMGYALIIGIFVSIVLACFKIISINIPLWWVVIQYLTTFCICKQTLDQIGSKANNLRHQLIAYSQILQLIANRSFKSDLGKEMQTGLAEALPSFIQLEKILKNYDRRGNFLGLFVTDSFFLSDLFLVRSFLKWKKMYVAKMDEWINIVSELDAIISMANYRFNHPEATDPIFTEQEEHISAADAEKEVCISPKIVFEAQNLYHPFLGEKAIKNDFNINDDHYYIITGANMAGKSTFLRSLGINYILAMAGMPVFADTFRISRFRLFSSMRTTDDLTHGISYFNAELIRLEQLLKYCEESTHMAEPLHTLIILDEILKGTNSLDKLNGSRKFLEAISKQPVSGIIATHDLELSKMEDDDLERFHNYCFEIDLGTDVTYTYKIKKGVARNQNATFLLNKILERY